MDQKQEYIKALEGEDDLGIVIRSQIVVERYLNHLIESAMTHPGHFRQIKMDYLDKVKLAIALGLNPRFESPLSALGSIRNDFAHNLREDLSKQDANNLYKALNSEDKEVVHSCLSKTRKKLPDEGIPNYQQLEPRDKYILSVTALSGALHVACS